MRFSLRLCLLVVAITLFCSVPSVHAVQPTAAVNATSAAGDSSTLSGEDDSCRVLHITVRRIKLKVVEGSVSWSIPETYWDYRWEATCDNVALDPYDIQKIGFIITSDDTYDHKMERISGYLATHYLWSESGTRKYIL